ncbi:MAG: hypothetical protein LKH53_09240 [Prevotella sp.]|jgi:hypothetical protein|nr:hypothetical protein [Prevotella sp.]MCI1519617.1 hypothetical protein [Prevotella sp.]MCI1549302.1 hypothetical protein [Prevotella sp.]MCI1596781.1 hypothetical protein [Prevotella sp.]
MERNIHRYAAYEVTVEGQTFHRTYVEVREGRVVGYGELLEEMAFTEWLGGAIEVKTDERGVLCAYCKNRHLE